MGYAQPGTNPLELVELAQEAERLGYDSAWAAEAWGTDAVSVLSWIAATTTTLKIGSAILQIPGRTPANAAMTAATLDLLSGGRFLLGLGTSGPQVVEGWHGQPWGKPLTKTREYVEIIRTVLRRELLEHHGEHYDIPYTGPGATGLGKPLKLMARPLRAEIPIYLASLAPRAIELAFEIADGWLPLFFSPERAHEVFPIDRAREGFDIAATAQVLVCDDPQEGIEQLAPQDRTDDLDVLARLLERLAPRLAVPALDDLRPRGAEAEQEAAAGEQVERRGGHGGVRGRPAGDLHDRRPELDALGARAEPGDRRDGVGAPRLRGPGGVVAELLGLLRHRDRLERARPRRRVAHVEAETHYVSPVRIGICLVRC